MPKKNANNNRESEIALGGVRPRELVEEMQTSYLDYAMSVIVARALPDVRDGLKPVHRRVLYVMQEEGLTHAARFRKSATVVGTCLARYHPHGDMAVYDTMARLAQDFSMRYPLVQGQGNFGCFTRDTKVRLTDGRSVSFSDLIEEQKKGKRHWTFSFNTRDKKVEIAEVQNPRLTRKRAELVEVVLDNGEKIRCTPDHRFLLEEGIYQEAGQLQTSESLMTGSAGLQNEKPALGAGISRTARGAVVRVCQPIYSLSYQKILSSVSSKAVEDRGVAPLGSWLTNPNRHYASPTAFPLYCGINPPRKVKRVVCLPEQEDVYDITVEPWHNFALGAGIFVHNSVDGDPPAASRYTEAKMSRIGEEMLRDIAKDTVDFTDNYDGTRKEPTVLPSPVPQLLLNGSLGIAVGMATNIPPHNIGEVVDAVVHLLEYPKATTEDLFQFVKGPDFPLGGTIYNRREIIEAYSQGKGPIVTRGKAEVTEEDKKPQIVITEIPYQVNKSTLVEQFARLVQEKKIEGIRDIRDESDKDGMRVVFDLQREAQPQKILNRLYKFSDLQKTFHLNMLALVDGIQPQVLSLPEVLSHFLEHRRQVITRRARYELKRAEEREHILLGLAKCLAKIDEVIRLIRGAADREDAKTKLMGRFRLTEIQANAILDMRLAQLSKLERKKIDDELAEIRSRIKELTALLQSPKKIDGVVKKELLEAKELFGDERRTKVVVGGVGEIAEEDLIPQEDTVIMLTQGGYIKRVNPSNYRLQKRGGRGLMGMKTVGDDLVEHFLFGQTHDYLMVFTDSGKVFRAPMYEIPEGSRVSKGRGLLNFFEMTPEDRVLSMFALSKKEEEAGAKNLLMVTKNGVSKKTPLEDFKNVRRSGLIALTLKKGDELRGVRKTGGEDEVLIATKKGQALHFSERTLRPMGRTAAGVRAMRLKKGDEVVAMDAVSVIANGKETSPEVLVLTENGYGKCTPLSEYRVQGRGGSGIKVMNVTPKTGNLVYARILHGEEEDLIVISQKGTVIRTPLGAVPRLGRSTQGVRIMRLEEKDKVVSAASS